MGSERFLVSASRRVREMIRDAMRSASVRGSTTLANQAASWIQEELARTPLQFGESRHDVPSMGLKVRLAFVEPFVVRFAVHEESHQVFILQFVHSTRPNSPDPTSP